MCIVRQRIRRGVAEQLVLVGRSRHVHPLFLGAATALPEAWIYVQHAWQSTMPEPGRPLESHDCSMKVKYSSSHVSQVPQLGSP